MNTIRTYFLMGILTLLFLWLGDLLGGRNGMIMALILAGAMNLVSYWLSDKIIQMAISRSREYLADRGGAELTQHPKYLANALKKLDYSVKRIPMKANPSTAHMFIVNPLRGKGLVSLFSTHPPIEERIRRLEAMERGKDVPG